MSWEQGRERGSVLCFVTWATFHGVHSGMSELAGMSTVAPPSPSGIDGGKQVPFGHPDTLILSMYKRGHLVNTGARFKIHVLAAGKPGFQAEQLVTSGPCRLKT